jgi:hypothetical protein
MLTRQKTLSQNIGIYVSLVALLGVHGWFWGSWLRSARASQEQVSGDVKKLKSEVTNLKNEAQNVKRDLEECTAELGRRTAELQELGNFLPSIDMKEQNLRLIMSLIEGLGIHITKTDFPPDTPPASGGGYQTVNFTLELQGPYRAFKQLLAKVQQTDMIIRIKNWELKDTGRDNQTGEWRVIIQFETYFEVAANRR